MNAPKKGFFGLISDALEKGKQNQQAMLAVEERRKADERAKAAEMNTFFTWAIAHAAEMAEPKGEFTEADFKNYLLSEDGIRPWVIATLDSSPLEATYIRSGVPRQLKVAVIKTPHSWNSGADGAHYWIVSQLFRTNGSWVPIVIFHFTDSHNRDIVAPDKVLAWQKEGRCWAHDQFNALVSKDNPASYAKFALVHAPVVALAEANK